MFLQNFFLYFLIKNIWLLKLFHLKIFIKPFSKKQRVTEDMSLTFDFYSQSESSKGKKKKEAI